MRVYISGKISGKTIEQASKDFEAVERRLTEKGYEAVNPLKEAYKVFGNYDEPYDVYMKFDLELLASCEAIVFLLDWKDSKGAREEKREAERLGLKKLTLEGTAWV